MSTPVPTKPSTASPLVSPPSLPSRSPPSLLSWSPPSLEEVQEQEGALAVRTKYLVDRWYAFRVGWVPAITDRADTMLARGAWMTMPRAGAGHAGGSGQQPGAWARGREWGAMLTTCTEDSDEGEGWRWDDAEVARATGRHQIRQVRPAQSLARQLWSNIDC